MKIIGVCGFQGAGKDTIADYLQNFHQFRRESFAGTLKDAVASIFGWDRILLEGRTKEAREWREQVDPWWAARLSMPTLTPRWVLQYWGTEVARRGFHDNIWISSLENKIRNSKDHIVVSDCRFPNEISSIKNAGGSIIWVQRGPLPDWYDDALLANTGSIIGINNMKLRGVHASEWAWLGDEFDMIIHNNGSIIELYNQLTDLLEISNQITLPPGDTFLP